MRNLFITICICLITIIACNNKEAENAGNNTDSKNAKVEKYLNHDDELDVRSSATVDTIEFRKFMTKVLPAKKIVELFGAGYQTFYLSLKIEPDGIAYGAIAPEASSWVTGLGNVANDLFKENVEVSGEYAIIHLKKGELKAINMEKDFYTTQYQLKNVFKAKAGMLGGKVVRSGKLFQLDISVSHYGNALTEWIIKEIDFSKFRPKLKNNLQRESFMGFFPTLLKDEYKSLKDKVQFPQEAIRRGVQGKVLIKLFFDENGKYVGYQLMKGLGYGTDEAVINAISDYPLSSYPSGEKTTTVLPFKFGKDPNTLVDLTASELTEKNPDKYNNLYVSIFNKLKTDYNVKSKFFFSIMINNEIVNKGQFEVGEHGLYFKWKNKPGTYDYVIKIDPENVLNDIDRSNNTIRGKLVIK